MKTRHILLLAAFFIFLSATAQTPLSQLIDSVRLQQVPDTSVAVSTSWALVKLPYANLRFEPDLTAELVSQALMGTPLRILEKHRSWYRVQTPDHYIAWVSGSGIQTLTAKELKHWRKARRYIVTSLFSYLYLLPVKDAQNITSNLVLGDILIPEEVSGDMMKLTTPDGRKGFVPLADIRELKEWAQQPFNANLLIAIARQLIGSTYLWGGTSTHGVDCSGLTKTCYFANGIILQRDASQQVLYGEKIAPMQWKDAIPGDLLYFGTKSGRVTHTALYIGQGEYIHASGYVKQNSIDPDSPDYLDNPFLSINRIQNKIDQEKGIISVKNHPWYF